MTDFSTFWETYPKDLCNRAGSKQEAQKVWDKITEDKEQIIVNIRELMRVDRKVKKTSTNKSDWIWPMAVTWLRQARWQDIESIKQTADMPLDVKTCSCSKPVQIVNQCWDCYGYTNRWGLKDEFIKNGLLHDESKAERTERCKGWLRQKGYLGTVIPERP